jgi:predicted Zn-dependent peptidase
MTVRTSALDNGLRIVSHRMPSVETVSLGVWTHAGTRNERAEVNGIAHMLEHMAFKGTRRRSARAIAEEIESVGGHLNAYTSREFTAYYATVLKGDETLALDILSDILQHSVFDESELDRERAVILQEIGQANDTPDDVIFDLFQETAFPDQPVGRPVLGTAELVRAMPRDALTTYMGEHYTAGRMVVAAAGNLDHDRLVGEVETVFSDVATGTSAAREPARYAGGEVRHDRDLEQVHLTLGFEGVAFQDPDYFALSVMSTLLGGGMSSRLFQEVREERGLVYAIYSFAASYLDGGLFGIYAGTGEDEAATVVPVICDILSGLAGTVADDELKRAKAQIKAGILMSLESTASRSEQLARQILVFDRPLSPDEVSARVDAVDREAIDRIARRLFGCAPTFAALGPIARVQPFDEIVERLG